MQLILSARKIDNARSDCFENGMWIIYFENDDCIGWTLFENLQEGILCMSGSRREVSQDIDIFSFVWHEINIKDTLSHGFYIEFFFIFWNVIDEYIGYIRFNEFFIRYNMLLGNA